MRWTTERINRNHWHRWFAWHPIIFNVFTDREIVTHWVWLEWVEREGGGGYDGWDWNYREWSKPATTVAAVAKG